MICRIVLTLSFVCAGAAVAGEAYSWTDANGVKHYSDSPPPASVTNSKRLSVDTTPTDPAAVDDTAKTEATGPAMAAAAGYEANDIVRNCQIAESNRTRLQAAPPAVDESGEPLDAKAAAAYQVQLDKANAQTKLFCAH